MLRSITAVAVGFATTLVGLFVVSRIVIARVAAGEVVDEARIPFMLAAVFITCLGAVLTSLVAREKPVAHCVALGLLYLGFWVVGLVRTGYPFGAGVAQGMGLALVGMVLGFVVVALARKRRQKAHNVV